MDKLHAKVKSANDQITTLKQEQDRVYGQIDELEREKSKLKTKLKSSSASGEQIINQLKDKLQQQELTIHTSSEEVEKLKKKLAMLRGLLANLRVIEKKYKECNPGHSG